MKTGKKNNSVAMFFYIFMILILIASAISCAPPGLNDKHGGAGAETDMSDYYTKEEVDGLIDGVLAGLGTYYTKEEVNDLIAELSGNEINLNDYYTKAEVDDLLAGSSTDLSAYYTKVEVDNLISGSSPDLSSYYTKYEVDNLFAANSYGYLAYSSSGVQFQFGDQEDWVDIPYLSTTFNLSSRKRVKITAFGSVHMSVLRDCSRGAVSFRYVIDGNAYNGVYASIMGDSMDPDPESFVKLYIDVPWAMTRIQYLEAGSHTVKIQVKSSNPGSPTQSMLQHSRYLYVETIDSVTN
ncbi:MAG: hypothetical protein JW822_14750 [Spirochaetales bacterium]|nr:hypothetical protein [Spirochaetales bacterium]